MSIAECGLKKKTAKCEMGRPMLFAQKVLVPEQQPKHPGTVKLKSVAFFSNWITRQPPR
jgi:hypothetical protein